MSSITSTVNSAVADVIIPGSNVVCVPPKASNADWLLAGLLAFNGGLARKSNVAKIMYENGMTVSNITFDQLFLDVCARFGQHGRKLGELVLKDMYSYSSTKPDFSGLVNGFQLLEKSGKYRGWVAKMIVYQMLDTVAAATLASEGQLEAHGYAEELLHRLG